jgi:hypothetical protein
MPASTSIRPLVLSNDSTRLSLRVSSISASAQNCWPPMAWRAPEMHTGRASLRAPPSSARAASSDSGAAMRNTRAELSWECTSLTRIPGGGFGFLPWPKAACGHAAARAASLRRSRRVNTRRILF